MNKIFKFNIILAFICFMVYTSCSDWTDTESIKLIESDIEKDDPELYSAYLANLREYRKTDHKIVYGWFDNVKHAPVSRGQQLTAIPDSVDIVNLMNPDELSSWTISEMSTIRDKGMKIVFNISYPDIEKEYEQYITQNGDENEEDETGDKFLAFAENYVDGKLSLVGKYGYDGISALFYGMKTNHLTEAEKALYLARENVFMTKMAEWVNQNPDKLFIFEGYPQNLTDKTILQKAEFIAVRCEALKYPAGLTYEVLQLITDGVPTDRFVITINAKSLDPTDDKTGYYFNTENKLVSCIPLAAEWVDSYESGFTKYGLAILNIQNEYYNAGNSYLSVRDAIATMNP